MTLATAMEAPIPAPVAARRVVIVDDHRAFAELLSGALDAQGMRVVGLAHNAARAVALARELQPDLLVMDIQLPRQDGIAATRAIREVAPHTVVVVLTAHTDPDWVVRAAQSGASGFVPKNGSLAELLEVLGRVRQGQMLVAPSTFSAQQPSQAPSSRTDVAAPSLTRREREVLECLSRGMQVKGVARLLGITPETCRGYVKALHAKLSSRSQLETVVKAQQLGLLPGPDAG